MIWVILLMLKISLFFLPNIAFANGDSGETQMIFSFSNLISPNETEMKNKPFSVFTIAPFSALSFGFGKTVLRKSLCFKISFS